MAHETHVGMFMVCPCLWKEEHHVRAEGVFGACPLGAEGSAGRQAHPALVLQQLGLSVV